MARNLQNHKMERFAKMYNSYFGFSESPFENILDQRFLFLSKDHREVLATLLYFTETKKGFAIVCGDAGTGKTMLIKSLLDRLPETAKPIIISNPYVNSQDILFYLAKTLGIKTTELGNVLALTDEIKDALIKARSQNRHVILIIDEAHLLSYQALEEIRLLSNIETPNQKLLQILLVGQYGLSHKLDRHEMRHLRQRINVKRFLSPLNPEEIIHYVDHRLKQVGSSFASVFEDKCLRLIFKMTEGSPPRINQLCDNALLFCMNKRLRKVNRKILKKAYEAWQTDLVFTPKSSKARTTGLENPTSPSCSRRAVWRWLSCWGLSRFAVGLGWIFFREFSSKCVQLSKPPPCHIQPQHRKVKPFGNPRMNLLS